MNDQMLMMLKKKLDELFAYGAVDVEVQRNALKEELQFYVLNFIYHHPDYSNWTMYGGSALRICHRLDRMSVDLDFEVDHPVSETFLNELKQNGSVEDPAEHHVDDHHLRAGEAVFFFQPFCCPKNSFGIWNPLPYNKHRWVFFHTEV